MDTYAVTWTVVTRTHRGRYFHPVANVPKGLDWHGAVDAARQVAMAHPELDVWYVPAQDSPQYPEDENNILLGSGRRLPIRWDSVPQVFWD